MIGAALAIKAAPWLIGFAMVAGPVAYAAYLSSTVDEQRAELDAAATELQATRAAADALAHELDVAQTALLTRDAELVRVRSELASRSGELRRVARREEVAPWARSRVPAAVAGILCLDPDDPADAACAAAGGAAGAVPGSAGAR